MYFIWFQILTLKVTKWGAGRAEKGRASPQITQREKEQKVKSSQNPGVLAASRLLYPWSLLWAGTFKQLLLQFRPVPPGLQGRGTCTLWTH